MDFRWVDIKNGSGGVIRARDKREVKEQLRDDGRIPEHCFVEEKYMELVKGV